ncbi:hypothetical protein BDI4_380018 [Burkholderia diffusa]|nr:hypothetical protein BDI4_380018 [Burkholderia diffusa]
MLHDRCVIGQFPLAVTVRDAMAFPGWSVIIVNNPYVIAADIQVVTGALRALKGLVAGFRC